MLNLVWLKSVGVEQHPCVMWVPIQHVHHWQRRGSHRKERNTSRAQLLLGPASGKELLGAQRLFMMSRTQGNKS